MKIINPTLAQMGGAAIPGLTAGDLYFLARAKTVIHPVATQGQPAGTDKASVFYDEMPTSIGATLKAAVPVAGTSEVEDVTTPAFFPVATKGSECAAIVSDLAWADQNLEAGYEFIYLLYSATAASRRYLVCGVLNSTQTLSNDPFGDAGTRVGLISGQAACWAAKHAIGINPF